MRHATRGKHRILESTACRVSSQSRALTKYCGHPIIMYNLQCALLKSANPPRPPQQILFLSSLGIQPKEYQHWKAAE